MLSSPSVHQVLGILIPDICFWFGASFPPGASDSPHLRAHLPPAARETALITHGVALLTAAYAFTSQLLNWPWNDLLIFPCRLKRCAPRTHNPCFLSTPEPRLSPDQRHLLCLPQRALVVLPGI